jgi:lipopolysaccharide/colanic/teichoic acid biosynthesis glycosyltransferase
MKPIENKKKKLHFVLKRLIDFSGSFIGLIVFTPLLIILLLLVWFKHGWPVFFTQERPGRYGKPFKMIKFRTMTNDCDPQGNLMADQIRTTKMGRFMRKNSLDELPELFNVLKGDMSLVGPRPLLVKYLPYFTEREKKRHSIRPGITGLAQVNGRNLLTWDERLEMDVQYVENLSIGLDVKILFLTFINVIQQKDVLAVSSEFIPDFDDYRKDQLKNKTLGN